MAQVLFGGLLLHASPARADEGAPPLRPFDTRSPYAVFHGSLMVGAGLRMNNPYRLATPLGSTAESVSITAPYLDVGLAATFGRPTGFQFGPGLRVSWAQTGVPQAVVTPFAMAYRRWTHASLFTRVGAAIVASPEVTWGLEAGAGGVWFVRSGIGLVGELVGTMVYGAGTREVSAALYPVLSGQAGLYVTWELLP